MTWTSSIRLSDLARGVQTLDLVPPAATLAAWGKTLGLVSLPDMQARITVRSWLDGAELSGRFQGHVELVCGVSLDPFIQVISGEIDLRVVPQGSANTPIEALAGEVDLDPEAPDPPDVLDGDVIDLAHILFEHLALAIDPFPRKPDAVFDYSAPSADLSPFSVLKQLKEKDQS